MGDTLRNNAFSPLVRGSRLFGEGLASQEKNGVCHNKMVWSCLMVHPVGNSAWSLCVVPVHGTSK